MKFLILPLLLPFASAFECYTCNSLPEEDDSQRCVDKAETCPDGVESCSMVMYVTDGDNKMHMRKFCTNPGTPIYQFLLFYPGSSLCQNIETKNTNMKFSGKLQPPLSSEQLLEKRKRRSSGMPAPPHAQSSNLLCVCSTELCNGGTFDDVLKRSMLRNIDEKMGLTKGSNFEHF
uniref:Sodefrin-like factor n=1 Tax=Acrobeloides nanus TaxID=290746 RepID=A0A914DS12_9BILA